MSLAALVAALGIFAMPVRVVEMPPPIPFFAITVQTAQALELPPPTPKPLSTAELVALATSTAKKYGLNADHFVKVISCESGWDPNITGDHGESIGIAQIHLPDHPNISRENALDPVWSINWMAKEWRADRAYEWTCWLDYYGQLIPTASAGPPAGHTI